MLVEKMFPAEVEARLSLAQALGVPSLQAFPGQLGDTRPSRGALHIRQVNSGDSCAVRVLTNAPCTHFHTLFPLFHAPFITPAASSEHVGPGTIPGFTNSPQKAPIMQSSPSFLSVMEGRMSYFPWCYYKTMVICARWLTSYKFSQVAEARLPPVPPPPQPRES